METEFFCPCGCVKLDPPPANRFMDAVAASLVCGFLLSILSIVIFLTYALLT
jgi:hypothetical protein